MVLSFIALTPVQMPSWDGLTWFVPVVLLAMFVAAGATPSLKETLRRLMAACILAVTLSGVAVASEFISMSPCYHVEPYSALWYALGCWW